jgi:hypothetical protein
MATATKLTPKKSPKQEPTLAPIVPALKKQAYSHLFGVGCSSIDSVWQQLVKALGYDKRTNTLNRVGKIQYIPSTTTKIKSAELYFVETVKTFIAVQRELDPKAAVIISDSPMLLNELPDVIPVDWQKKESWRFLFHPIDAASLASGIIKCIKREREFAEVIPIDRIGLIIEEKGDGLFLKALVNFSYQLDNMQRVRVREEVARYLLQQITIVELRTRITAANQGGNIKQAAVAEVMSILETHGDVYIESIAKHLKGKSFKSLLKDTIISEFEIKYLAAICKALK